MKKIFNIFLLASACAQPPATPAPQPAVPATASTAGAPSASAGSPKTPQTPWLKFDWTAEQLTAECDRLEKLCEAELAKLVAIPHPQRTFANTVEAYEQTTIDYFDSVGRMTFMKDMHPDERVRAAAARCEERSGKYTVRIGSRKDIYLGFKGYLDNAAKTEQLDAEAARLLEVTMRDFRRAGLALSDADREKLVALRSRLQELQTRFSHHLEEDQSTVEVTEKELEGMPPEFIRRLKRTKKNLLVLTTQYPDYYPVMENAKNEATRKKMQIAFTNRGGDANVRLLEEAVAVRDEAARLLGYSSHADYVTETRMAKSAKAASDFEARMREGLKKKLGEELEKLRQLKVAETKQKNAQLYSWDWRYYLAQLKKRDYAIDDQALRAYFPSDRVLKGMFEVYETLLGVKLNEVPNAKVWADGVKVYEVKDQESGQVVAKFYLDLYPRAGKYGHAACFPLGLARQLPDGYRIPLSVLLVNFNPPSDNQASKLSVKEVTTLFHEFGHVMHASLTTARYASLAGSNVATDFVEAPSQIFENWVFEPSVLKKISIDPKDPTKGMPEELAKQVIAARQFDTGIMYSRQVFLGTFDLDIHTAGPKVDADKVAKKRWQEIVGFPLDAKEKFPSSFGHMMGGYDAGYYGYLWSEVFSADMFARFEKEGVLNPKTGRDYRNVILARGRIEEADKLLEKFLGRAPNEEAFLRQLGLKKD